MRTEIVHCNAVRTLLNSTTVHAAHGGLGRPRSGVLGAVRTCSAAVGGGTGAAAVSCASTPNGSRRSHSTPAAGRGAPGLVYNSERVLR